MKSLENFTSSNLIDPKEYGVDLKKSALDIKPLKKSKN